MSSFPQTGFPKRCSRFLGTVLLHTLGCYQVQPMSASQTYFGEVDEQLLQTIVYQTKILRRLSSSIRVKSSTLVSAY